MNDLSTATIKNLFYQQMSDLTARTVGSSNNQTNRWIK